MSELYGEVPQNIVDDPDEQALGAYLTYLNAESAMSQYGMHNSPLERVDDPTELRKMLQTPQLTPETRSKILTTIRTGVYPETAAATAGIPVKVWRGWMESAVKGLEPFYTFWREAIAAEAEAEAELTRCLQKSDEAADARFLLERRFSRTSLAEDPVSKGVKWRKPTQLEVAALNQGDEEDFKFSNLKPVDRGKAVAEMLERLAIEAESAE